MMFAPLRASSVKVARLAAGVTLCQGTRVTCGALRRANSSLTVASGTHGKRRVAVYGGTFDPPSVGHNDVIKRALALCDTLVVACGINTSKKPIFSLDERLGLLRRMVDADIPERAADVHIGENCSYFSHLSLFKRAASHIVVTLSSLFLRAVYPCSLLRRLDRGLRQGAER